MAFHRFILYCRVIHVYVSKQSCYFGITVLDTTYLHYMRWFMVVLITIQRLLNILFYSPLFYRDRAARLSLVVSVYITTYSNHVTFNICIFWNTTMTIVATKPTLHRFKQHIHTHTQKTQISHSRTSTYQYLIFSTSTQLIGLLHNPTWLHGDTISNTTITKIIKNLLVWDTISDISINKIRKLTTWGHYLR